MSLIDDIPSSLGGGAIDSFAANLLIAEDNILANDIRELNADLGITIEEIHMIDNRLEPRTVRYMNAALNNFINVQTQIDLEIDYNIQWPNNLHVDFDLLHYREEEDALEWTRKINLLEVEVEELTVTSTATIAGLNIVAISQRIVTIAAGLTLIGKNKFIRVFADRYFNPRMLSVINELEDAPLAFYGMSKTRRGDFGNIIKLTGSAGIGGPTTVLSAKWDVETHFELAKTKTAFDGDYAARTGPTNLIASSKRGSGSELVVLLGTTYTELRPSFNRKYGNHIITVSNAEISVDNPIETEDQPTAMFFLSKNRPDILPNIMNVIKTPGFSSFERLEIKWDPDEDMKLRKDGELFDGTYNILYALDPVHIDIDIGVTLLGVTAYTEKFINQQNRLTTIISVDAGVSGVEGFPSAIFSITKSDRRVTANINRLTNSLGISSLDKVELDYPINDVVKLNKTGTDNDGSYRVKVFFANN